MPQDRPVVGFDREALVVPRVSHREGSWSEREHRLLWSTRRRPHHDPFSTRSVVFSTLLFVFVVLNMMDAATTLFATARFGWSTEGNALLRWVGVRFGAAGFLVYKGGVVAAVVAAFWLLHRGFQRAASFARAPSSRRVFQWWGGVVEGVAVLLVVSFLFVVVNNIIWIGGSW